MNLKLFYDRALLIAFCFLYNVCCIWGAELNFDFTGDKTEIIEYNRATLKNSDVMVDKSKIDLSCIELQDEIYSVKLSACPDSNKISVIFNDCIKQYNSLDNHFFCHSYETPLTRITYRKPKLSFIDAFANQSNVQMSYMGDGVYCDKDSIAISGNVSMARENKAYVILPSLDTIKSVVWMTRMDEEHIRHKSSMQRKELLLLEETSFVYLKGFDYPIFIDCQKTYKQKGKTLSKSRDMWCLDRSFLNDLQKINAEGSNSANGNSEIDIVGDFHVYDDESTLNATFSTTEDTDYNIIVANVSGILYASKKGHACKGVSQSVKVDVSCFPSGKYAVYLNVKGKRYSRVINI